MLIRIRRHLTWKLFISYLIVILVGVVVLAATAEIAIPTSFERHMAAMATMMGEMMGGGGGGLERSLFANFRSAVNEALLGATLASLLSAVIVSLLISRQIVTPVRRMMDASSRIADGNYEERVSIPGERDPNEMDELGLLAVRFNQMAEKLEQTESMRRELIGDVAHELRTPLTTIKGSMEGLIDGVLEADVRTFRQVYKEVDRLGRLVDDLQELSRVEGGAFVLETSRTPVAGLIEATRARLGRQFHEKGVTLEVDLPEDLPPVHVDRDRIGQVLLNLAGNALQYTPEGGEVEISACEAGAEVQIHVRDTGVGIPPEHMPFIFSRFYRVDSSRSRAGGGSGIGLTIAKHLVEAHGGRIWAKSPGPGQGSTFTFTLPIAD